MVSSRINFFMYVKVGVSEDDAQRGAGASFEGDCAPADAEPTQICLWRLACLAQSVSDQHGSVVRLHDRTSRIAFDETPNNCAE